MTTKIQVLLVEDDEDDYLITRDLLNEIDPSRYALTWCDDYACGRDAVLAGAYDVCLLDHRLGAHTGLELLHAAHSAGVRRPIILLTGLGTRETDLNAMRAGAADFLVKGRIDALLLERVMRYAIERVATLEALRISEERYALVARGTGVGLWDWDIITNRIYYSPGWKVLLGLGEETPLDENLSSWYARIHNDDLNKFRNAIEDYLTGITPNLESDHRIRHYDGTFHWYTCRGLALRDEAGHAFRIAGSLMDVTDRYVYDALTGLPNRLLFMDRLAHALRLTSTGRICALLLIDLEQVNLLNENLGFSVGERLLAAFAERLRSTLRPATTLGRLEGGHFGVLLEELGDATEVTRVAQRIQQAMQRPFLVNEHELFITTGIGIALSQPGYTDDATAILRDAGNALRRARSIGRDSCILFDDSMQAGALAVIQMETNLRLAVARQEFITYYQPIIDLKSQRIAGMEALLRWVEPSGNMVSPARFIPIVEDCGLIYVIGHWVLRDACLQLQSWRQEGIGQDIFISVNLSSRQLVHPDLFNVIKGVLDESGLPATVLKLEITESALMSDPDSAIALFNRLKALGIRFSMDDFGTGYSSLSYLQRLPIDTLKIDRSFVSRIESDPEGAAICTTIVSLAHTLKLDVVAEGIETIQQQQALTAIGCEYGQGYLYAKPLPAAELYRLWLS